VVTPVGFMCQTHSVVAWLIARPLQSLQQFTVVVECVQI
jgi:hypothetical protein